MNFVVIMNDTLRADYLAAYGNDWCKTPTAARFGQEAAVFDNCFVGSFPTIPNRTDLFTGRFGEPLHPWLPLDCAEPTMPELMGKAGHVTQLICDTPHLIQGGHNFDFPFNAWRMIRGCEVDRFGMDSDPLDLPTTGLGRFDQHKHAAQFIRNHRGRRYEWQWETAQTYQAAIDWIHHNAEHEKFFLWIDSFDPHSPLAPPRHYTRMYDPTDDDDIESMLLADDGDASKLDEARVRNLKARYAGTVTFVDRYVGRLLQAIEDMGLSENTCVVWISDHGCHLNEHGGMLGKDSRYDEAARTVLMVKAPGLRCAGKRFSDLVQPADLAPTLLEMAGIDAPERMQGKSYLPLLKGEPFESRPYAISGHRNMNANLGKQDTWLMIRDGRWVLCDNTNTSLRELYHTEVDPKQLRNVAPDHPDEVERLHQAGLEFLRAHEAQPQIVRAFETGDPGDMTGYRHTRPGFENTRRYWVSIRSEPTGSKA